MVEVPWYNTCTVNVVLVDASVTCTVMYVCGYSQNFQQSMDQPGMVINPARGQLNRENEYFPVPVRA